MSAAEEWARCRPWLIASLERDGGFHAIGDVERAVAEGRAQFWPGVNAAAVSEWWNFPRFRALNLWLVGGDLAECLTLMLPAIERWAIEQDCTRLMGFGRPGWKKAGARHGFRPVFTAYLKELSA